MIVKPPALDLPNLLDPISVNLPAQIAGMRRDRCERLLQGLYVIARTGFSLALELRLVTEANLFLAPGNRSVQRVFMRDLPESGLVLHQKHRLFRSTQVLLLRLSPAGQDLCRQLGWLPIKSEWEHLILRHRGDDLAAHTTGLLTFCFQARLRDWHVTLLPEVEAAIEPDACLSKGTSGPLYIEFETAPHDKLEKWHKAHRFQGLVAAATFTPSLRRHMLREFRQAQSSGIASDLLTLARAGHPGQLWQECFTHWRQEDRHVQRWLEM